MYDFNLTSAYRIRFFGFTVAPSVHTMITYLCFLFLVVVVLSCFFLLRTSSSSALLSFCYFRSREQAVCARALRVVCGNVYVCLCEARNKAKNFSHYTKHYFIFLPTEKPTSLPSSFRTDMVHEVGKCENLSSCIECAQCDSECN